MPESDTEETSLSLDGIFTEPPRPPTPPRTVVTYERERQAVSVEDWCNIEITLVGSHPLWGHYLWNASRAFASFLDSNPKLCLHRTILELGAGGGLPGIVAAKNGAKVTVLTDYPDQALLETLRLNASTNITARDGPIHIEGYIWGRSVEPLLRLCSPPEGRRFDMIVMSDLIFNHSQHDALLNTCEAALEMEAQNVFEPCLLVFYTHHRPHLAHRDMEFFEKAKQHGWICEEILTKRYPPMFPDDPGEEEVRATVHGWKLTRGSI